MKTLQQPVKPVVAPGPSRRAASPPLDYDFSADEVYAADVLIFLREGSTSTGGTPVVGEGTSVGSAVSGSSSPRSVNAPPAPAPAPPQPALPRGVGAGGDAEEEDDEQEVPGSPRRIKRNRPIAEIYRATRRIARGNFNNME